MNAIFKSLGFNDYFKTNENKNKLINYIKDNKNIIKGIEKSYINVWENNIKKHGVQFSVEKGLENAFDCITPHITNNNVWKLRILEDTDKDLFLCEDFNINNGKCAINIINKDILPSHKRYDSCEVQVSGFNLSNIKLFTKKAENKSALAEDVTNSNRTALFKVKYTDNSPCKDESLNIVCGIVYGFGKIDVDLFDGFSCYYASFKTHFGNFTLYFPEESIDDKEGLFDLLMNKDTLEEYIYAECLCFINGDAYLSDELSAYKPTYENNLSLCRRAFNKEEYDFIYEYLREDCTYRSNKWQLNGRDEILKKFKEISSIKCNINMKKILLLSTENESKKKYEGKEILLYTEEGKTANNPFYVETDEEGKIYNIEMDSNSIAHWGVNYLYSLYQKKLWYIENVEELDHQSALNKINSLEFNDGFDKYFDILCDKMLNSIKNRKFAKKKNKDVYYFTAVKVNEDKKNKQYNIEYNRSNNFGVDNLLYYNFLCLLFKPNDARSILNNEKYYFNRSGIRFTYENDESYYKVSELKKIYKNIKELDKLLSKELDKDKIVNKLLYQTIDTFEFPDVTYKYLSFNGKVNVFNYCREEIRSFYKDFIKYMTILINVAEKNQCDYISIIINH